MHAGNGVQNKGNVMLKIFCKRIIQALNDLDSAVREWRKRLRACVKAKGGQFEYNL